MTTNGLDTSYMIGLIAIVDERFGVAKNGDIPWRFPEDMRFFYEKTKNCAVAMGRRTFFSIKKMPLRSRINCVISRTLRKSVIDEMFPAFSGQIEIFRSLESAIERYSDLWIIGGAETYNYALRQNLVEYALITQVHRDHQADIFLHKPPLLLNFAEKTIEENEKYSVYEFSLLGKLSRSPASFKEAVA
jgi:dihydrofolate reductase